MMMMMTKEKFKDRPMCYEWMISVKRRCLANNPKNIFHFLSKNESMVATIVVVKLALNVPLITTGSFILERKKSLPFLSEGAACRQPQIQILTARRYEL